MTEKLYTDFTNKVLPAIQEGLVITQEYFTELFSRYVKYLIITDAIFTFIGFVFLVGSLLALVPLYKRLDLEDKPDVMFLLFPLVFGAYLFFDKGDDLIKAIYIPEVRVYEELKPLMK